MAIDFKTLIGVAFDIKQAQSELDRQIKSLQKNSKLALEIELSDKDAKKAIQDQTKAWSNYRKEAVEAMTAPNTELEKMGQYYREQEKEIQKNISLKKKMYLDEANAYKINESINQKRITNQSKLNNATQQAYQINNKLNDSMSITKTRSEGANRGFSAYLKTLKPQALKEYSAEINKISNAFSESAKNGDKVTYSKANASLSKFKSTMKDTGMETASFSQILKQNIGAFSQWLIIGNVVSGVMRNFKDAIGTIKEVDTLLTEISKTSDLTGESLKELGINAFDAASKYGNTVQSYLEGYKEMSRGTDKATAQGLAEMSILAQSAGDMTAELANEYIIATNAAYKFNNEVSKINSVLDSQNQVSNRNQISMSKIAEATKVAGSVAANSGVEINELTAAISVMGVVTQGEGQEIGRAFKGILQNLQQVKGETDDGEIIDTESLSKVEKATEGLGVKLKETRNGILSLRDPMQVLKELATEYSKLEEGDVRGANLITALGGKYRSNQLSALLSNYDMYTKILGDYENANGSALSEAQKTADSIEGRLNKLTNTWNEAIANVVSSDMLKTFVSIGTGAIELTDDLNLLQTVLIGLGGLGAYKGLTTLVPMLQNAISSTVTFGNALNTIKANDFATSSVNISQALKGLTQQQMLTALSSKQMSTQLSSMSEAQIVTALTTANLSVEEAKSTASTLAMSSANTVATGTTLGFGASIKALTTAMMANPIGVWITAITVAISALSFGLSKYKQAQEEALQVSNELTDAYKNEKQSLDDQITTYKKLQKQLDEGNLSVEETRSIKEQLIGIQNGLIDTYGSEIKELEKVNGKYEDQLGLLDELSKKKAQDFIAENKSGFESSKDYLNDKNNYRLTGYNGQDMSPELSEYLSGYLKELSVREMGNANGELFLTGRTEIVLKDMSVDKAYDTLTQLYTDIDEKFGNGADAEKLKLSISNVLNQKFDKTEIEKAQSTIDSYIEAQVIASDSLRPLYQQSIKAVEDYNNALASGEGIEEAKSNLDSIKDKVVSSTSEIDGSQKVFDNLFSNLANGSNQAVNSIDSASSKVASSLSSTIAENEKAIDNYQSQIKTIESSLKDVSSLSSSNIIDLMQQFSDFDWGSFGVTGVKGVGDLKGALESLAKEQYNSLDATLKDNEAFKQMYQEAINASNGVISLSDAISTLSSNSKTIASLKEELKETGHISASTVSSLMQMYPALTESLSLYLAGKVSEKDIMSQISEMYAIDEQNYKKATISKLATSESFYKSIGMTDAKLVNSFKENYGVDLKNVKSYAKAKLEIENQLLDSLKFNWSQYYNTQLDSFSDDYAKLGMSAGQGNAESLAKLKQLESGVSSYRNAVKGLNDISYKGIDVDNINFDSSKTKKDSKDSKQTIDWISRKLEVLKTTYDKIKQRATDILSTHIAQNKELDKAKKNLQSQIKIQNDSYDKYMKQAKGVGLSASLISKVQNGSMDIKQYDDKTAKKIEEYKKWYDAAEDVGKTIKGINEEIDDLKSQKLDNITSYFEGKRVVTSSRTNKRQSLISNKEASGGNASVDDYNYLIQQEQNNKRDLQEQFNKSKVELDSWVADGLSKSSQIYKDSIAHLNDLEAQILDCETAQIGFNRSILELPISNIEKLNKKLQNSLDTVTDLRDDYDSIIGAVTSSLDDEIQSIERFKSNEEDYYNKLIENEQSKLDALQKTNDERQKAFDLQKAQYDLERAQNQKTSKVYREGQGFIYESDTDAIREAQNTLDNLAYENIISIKESEIDALEKAKENSLKSYDKQIDSLNEIKDSWSSLADEFERLASIDLAKSLFGEGWQDSIANGDTKQINLMESLYGSAEKQAADLEAQIKRNEQVIQSLQEYADAWDGTEKSFSEAYDKIQAKATDTIAETQATQERADKTKTYSDAWDLTKTAVGESLSLIEESQTLAKENEYVILEERLENIRVFAEEFKKIAAECSSALSSIQSDLASAKQAQAELNNISSSSSGSSSSTSKSSSGILNFFKAGKSHDGMELGYIKPNMSASGSKDSFEMMSLNKLAPNEIARILKVDEAVLTKLQQNNVMSNLASSFQAGYDASQLPQIIPKSSAPQNSFSFTGDIHLHEVQDVNGLTDAISKEFLPQMNQKLYKKS